MNIEKKAAQTIKKYKLIGKDDKVVVALSGGKDSTSVFYILHKLGYNVRGLMIDLHLGNWSRKNRKNMEEFCKELGVKLTVVDLKKEFGQGICYIKAVAKQQKNLTGCTVCGIIKKWILNKWARKLGADKIVTGHNLDDECQTVLMNFLKGNVFLGVNAGPATGKVVEQEGAHPSFQQNFRPTLSPVSVSITNLGSDRNKRAQSSPNLPKASGFVQRVKPLFFIPENEIKKYSKKMKFPVLYERCPCAIGTYRVDTRAWLDVIDNKEKLKIVENFQKLIPKLREKKVREIRKCKICGEPATWEVCNACKIFECLS